MQLAFDIWMFPPLYTLALLLYSGVCAKPEIYRPVLPPRRAAVPSHTLLIILFFIDFQYRFWAMRVGNYAHGMLARKMSSLMEW